MKPICFAFLFMGLTSLILQASQCSLGTHVLKRELHYHLTSPSPLPDHTHFLQVALWTFWFCVILCRITVQCSESQTLTGLFGEGAALSFSEMPLRIIWAGA